VVFLLEGALVSWLLAMDERSGHKNLRGLDRWSVIPYAQGRIELYCSSLYEPEPFLFFDLSEVASTRAFYSSRSGGLQ
jgi:hypothetical protein